MNLGTPQSQSDSPATVSPRELEEAVRPRQGFTNVPKALSNEPGCNDSEASSRVSRDPIIQHPCPLGEGQSAISQESRGSLRNAVSAKALNLEDFSRQTFPESGREAGLDRLGVRLSRWAPDPTVTFIPKCVTSAQGGQDNSLHFRELSFLFFN